MADSTVKDSQCESRMATVWERLDEHTKEISTMSGGVKTMKWVIPILIALSMAWTKMTVDRIMERIDSAIPAKEFPQDQK